MTNEAWIVFDLGFGDAGKGATVDFLVRDLKADLVVRHHGGGQAGHNVVTPDGRHHTFSQFGAGTFVPGVRTLLGPEFVFHPGALWMEALHLESLGLSGALDRIQIDERARVISPFQQASGRLRELLRGDLQHGTCGVGVGEAVMDSIHQECDTIVVRDFADLSLLAKKLSEQQLRKRLEFRRLPQCCDERSHIEYQLLSDSDCIERIVELWRPVIERLCVLSPDAVQNELITARRIVFEGAQGVLLDQCVGFHPHTTWSDCTPRGAMSLLDGLSSKVYRMGVVRTYMVRHGLGPFPTCDPASEWSRTERHNQNGGWQGPLRSGPIDLVLLRYALAACGGADGLALTHLDCVPEVVPICRAYRANGQVVHELPLPNGLMEQERLTRMLETIEPIYDSIGSDDFIERLGNELHVPISLISTGPTCEDRRWLTL
ncbi:MAG: adenylosuccinate synthetase [Planctomycetota bacterium]